MTGSDSSRDGRVLRASAASSTDRAIVRSGQAPAHVATEGPAASRGSQATGVARRRTGQSLAVGGDEKGEAKWHTSWSLTMTRTWQMRWQ